MSAAPRYPREYGYAGLRMTADEFLSLGETPERYELIDGVVVMSPSPTPTHSELLLELAHQLKLFARKAAGLRVFSETDVRLSPTCVYQPDMAVYRPGRLPADIRAITIPPDLAVEFLSPSSKATDLITKREDYDHFGVGEYWAIDPTDARIRAWTRQGVHLLEVAVEGDQCVSAALPGFVLDIAALRAFARPDR